MQNIKVWFIIFYAQTQTLFSRNSHGFENLFSLRGRILSLRSWSQLQRSIKALGSGRLSTRAGKWIRLSICNKFSDSTLNFYDTPPATAKSCIRKSFTSIRWLYWITLQTLLLKFMGYIIDMKKWFFNKDNLISKHTIYKF